MNLGSTVKTAAMRAMLAKDVLERFLDGPFNNEELRNRVSAHVGEKAARTGRKQLSPTQKTKTSTLYNSDVHMIDPIRRPRRRVSFAAGVVERAIPLGSARQRMIVRTWMRSEQSRPVMLTATCLAWIGVVIPL